MQRYPATSLGGGISNNSVSGPSSRENSRVDSAFSTSNFSVNSRRPSLLPYKLKCDKEPLNSRLGPPDFYPQTPNCPEETITRECIGSGYKETVEGIEEAREIVLTQTSYFSKPEIILKCKEAIRKRLRLINESRAQKRKAGQVYGVPLSGSLLIKPGVIPDQRAYSEDFRRKWIEALSQQHKRLSSLADHIPHGYRKKSLFEVLIRYNVPLLKATWFIKVTYLNQVRPATSSVSSGTPDKTQFSRTELWTKDVIEYLNHLLDEFFSKDGFSASASGRDPLVQTALPGLAQQRTDAASVIHDVEEPSLQFKWWYMVRLLNWHYAEGLLLPSVIIEWVLNQLQEKESAEALELLLPVVFDVIESISLSQAYVRTFVEIAVRSVNDLWPAGSSFRDDSRTPPIPSALIEMLRFLILSVPDTFVALDCFQLPTCVFPDTSFRNALMHDHGDTDLKGAGDTFLRYVSFGYVMSTIQKRASNLAKVVSPSLPGYGAARVLQFLDKSILVGDVRSAYESLFEDFSDVSIEERWIAEVSPCLRSSLKWIGSVSSSLICSVFFLCEWATCDYRDCRSAMPYNIKFSGGKDIAQVYIAVLMLKLKKEDLHNPLDTKSAGNAGESSVSLHDKVFGRFTLENAPVGNNARTSHDRKNETDNFQSPGPLHDIIVCWLDQHEIGRGFGSLKRLEVLVLELIHNGIFHPQAYLRQLIVSGIMDRSETTFDQERRARHQRIIKQLPGAFLIDVLEEAQIAESTLLYEVIDVYSNERRLLLHGLISNCSSHSNSMNFAMQKQNDQLPATKGGTSPNLVESCRKSNLSSSPRHSKVKKQVSELKGWISTLLRLPYTCYMPIEAKPHDPQVSVKRPFGSLGIKMDTFEGTPGCEECKRAKKQKLTDERSSSYHVVSLNHSDDEESWWLRKELKSQELFKVDPPLKATKNASRGRQKMVRKTQSLAQLAAARIESSQGASTSHVCDSKVSCPHHRTGAEGDISKNVEQKAVLISDIGKSLKRLRLLEKRSISIWLLTSVKELIVGNEKSSSKQNNCAGAFSAPFEDKSAGKWRLGEDELSAILYILDISCDLILAVRFILWLLPKIVSGSNNTVHVGRNVGIVPKEKEAYSLHLGEGFLLSALQRFENVVIAADLLPEVLTASMHRTISVLTSNGRTTSSGVFVYARNLLKKYREVASVVRWEKKFRPTCDQRLLAELDAGRTLDGDLGFSSSASAGMNDFDEYFRQKMSGRISRTGPIMKEIVQSHVDEVVRYLYGKERKGFVGAPLKSSREKWDDASQVAQDIVQGLVDCIRQNGGATLEGDPSIVASSVSAIVNNIGPAVIQLLDVSPNGSNISSASSHGCVGHIIQIHINSLGLLKESLGERFCRIFDLAVAVEVSSAISGAYMSGKNHRSQFQPSPEIHDMTLNHSNESMNNSTKIYSAKAAKAAAAISALVVGLIVHGVISLERMIVVLKLKEGLDVMQFFRSTRTSSNGISRGSFKLEHSLEVYIHWFRLLIGNCRTIFDGLLAEIVGEPYILALSKIQRNLPLNLVFPPAYSIFAMVIWRPYILNSNAATREDIQLYHYLSLAIGDAIKHQPFRDLCLRNTHAFYDLLSSDTGDSEFAAMLEMHNSDKHTRTMAFVPLRARMFLNAVVDCKMPPFTVLLENGSWVSASKETRETEGKILDKVVHVFDTLQPAKFHWQWVELRLLLNEQALIEKIETKDMSFVEAIRSLSPNAENLAISESEKFLSEIVLTRILVRPDAAPLYAEIAHLLGRSLEESLVMDIKWILAGGDVLSGRKSIRQQLISVAQRKGLSTKPLFWKPWGWTSSTADAVAARVDRSKPESVSIEEGEVVDEFVNVRRGGKTSLSSADTGSFGSIQQYATEKALAELLLPCIDRSSTDLRNSFTAELIKQMSTIDQQIHMLARGGSKQTNTAASAVEVSSNKSSSRKGMRGGSPGMGRRAAVVVDSSPPSAAALKTSMWLRFQFIVRLLPIVYADREPSSRNMRHTLASIILRLLGTRFIHEDADIIHSAAAIPIQRREAESSTDASTSCDHSGDSLFDMLLSLLHGLLSSCKPSWLKPKSASKSTVKSPRDFSAFDREVAESLQTELDRIELPATIRRRIQSAMPILPQSLHLSLSCQPPTLSSRALTPLQPGLPAIQSSHLQRLAPCQRSTTNLSAKTKSLSSLESDTEIDPWTLLEEGTVPASASNSSGSSMGAVSADHSNLKACSWLKGAVRVRRTDLTYVGALDEDS